MLGLLVGFSASLIVHGEDGLPCVSPTQAITFFELLAMKSLWYFPFVVSVTCAVARSTPPEDAIVVAKTGGDFDSVCFSWTRTWTSANVDAFIDWQGNHVAECWRSCQPDHLHPPWRLRRAGVHPCAAGSTHHLRRDRQVSSSLPSLVDETGVCADQVVRPLTRPTQSLSPITSALRQAIVTS